MPKVIVKCRYYSSKKSVRDIGGLLRYIATREGVEKFDNSWKTAPASKAQKEIILRFTNTFSASKRLSTYRSYLNAGTKSAASEFISSVLENNPDLLTDKTYMDYIATRPRVERVAGTHGLFTDKDTPISLSQEVENLRKYVGNVFTIIVSLKREDAERLGYNIADRWTDFVRRKIGHIAKAHNIPLHALKWFGAYHNESHHPHIHLMLYSTDEKYPGHIDRDSIHSLRHDLGTHIFADELKNTYEAQTEYRNQINTEALDEIKHLAEMVHTGLAADDVFQLQFVALAKHLQSVSGKKVFGYLPKSVKKQVCDLVDLLAQNANIARMYEMWYQAKCDVHHTYTDTCPVKKPLSQEEAFKPIRNALIREADALGKQLDTMHVQEEIPAKEPPPVAVPADDIHFPAQPSPATSTPPPSAPPAQRPAVSTVRSSLIATSVTSFARSLVQTFCDNYQAQIDSLPTSIDSKLHREIEAKKRGQNLSM